MSWRKCLVRGLVFTALAALAAAGLLYRYLTHPGAIRQQVVAQLEEQFVGANVTVESACLNLFGGITLTDLRLIRRDDPDKIDFLYVPSATIYHDKEQLLDGKIAIRKVELHRPRLRVIRGADGAWNFKGVIGPVDPSVPLPTIVLQHATLTFEDRQAAPDMAPVELQNLNITLLNDPLPTLQIVARGASDLVGSFYAKASWQRATEAIALELETINHPVGASLIQRLGAYCCEISEHGRHLEGQLKVRFNYRHDPAGETHHEVRAELAQGKFRHPDLPLPLEQLEAAVVSRDGQLTLENLSARSGKTRLELKGATAGPLCAAADLEGELAIEQLTLNPELFQRLPGSLKELQEDFSPAGVIGVKLTFGRTNGAWRRQCLVRLEDGASSFIEFPYRLEHIRGTIEQEVDATRQLNHRQINVVGSAGGQNVHVKGTVSGSGPRPAVDMEVWGANIDLDQKLQDALPAKYQRLAAEFHPQGKGDFWAKIWRPQGERCSKHIIVKFHDAALRYDVFPYPLEDVRLTLEIQPDHWTFRDFSGNHKGCVVRGSGRSDETPDGDRMHIDLEADGVLLDAELQAALPPRLQATWKSLAPGGRVRLVAAIDRPPGQTDEDIDATVYTNGSNVRPDFFPLRMDLTGGAIRYAQNQVAIENLVARHGDTTLTLDRGDIYLKPVGGFYARFTELRGNPLVPDAEVTSALPPGLQKIARTLKLRDPLGMTAKEIIVDMPPEPNVPPVIYWDGGLALREAKVNVGVDLERVRGQFWCRGRHNGRDLEGVVGNLMLDQAILFKQPLQDIHTHVEISKETPDVIRLPDLKARFFGGDIGGEARVEFGPTLHYELNLTALQVQLEEFGRHNLGAKAEYKGQATARLYLTGQGTEVHGLEGRGSVDMPSGQLYNLPLLLDLLKVLGLRVPDRTAFEEAHATFSIKGPRVSVSRLDLYGNAISLSGQGEMNLDGSDLQLDFYAVWGRIMQVLPPVFRPIPSALSQQLLKIKMRGKVDDVRCTREPVPILVEPLERLLRRLDRNDDSAPKDKGNPSLKDQGPRALGEGPRLP